MTEVSESYLESGQTAMTELFCYTTIQPFIVFATKFHRRYLNRF